eukprot:TRINITY_DN4469_c0_g1_i1.p1 TRINITY_DN4469_c0_g1~~TRINITY_DN4469_c0_g1_i1.p1  ORF type:complete len:156 (+),score=62.36 TRINITY_DN4469_c0_g1_i1:68-535(+)
MMSLSQNGLSEEQIQEYRHVFQLFDSDNSGAICLKELGSAMKSLGMKPTDQELEDMVKEVDIDGGGEIEFDEFLHLVSKQVTEPELLEQLERVFHKFDDDKDGYINSTDLVYALKTFANTQMTDEEARELMSDVDPNGDGKIDLAEFIKLMCEPY